MNIYVVGLWHFGAVTAACLERFKQQENSSPSLPKASALAIFLATEQNNGISGKLISAVWDNLAQWPAHISVLNSSDLYTLRRISGRDRG
jgi:3-oxoacyl-[acyl-carrier protein] reductase